TRGFHERPLVTSLMNTSFVVAWRTDPAPPGGNRYVFRIIDVDGGPLTAETVINTVAFDGRKALTFLDSGKFAIAYVRVQGRNEIGEELSNVEIRFFDASGTFTNILFSATSAAAEGEITTSSPA